MRIFEHPNLINFKCPICKTAEDKSVTLIGIDGTEEGNIMQAEQFHMDCLELYWKKAKCSPYKSIIYQWVEEE